MSDPSDDRENPAPPPTEVMHPTPPLETATELVRVLDQYMADLKSGMAPDRIKLLADHPALAAQLEPCLAGIEFICQAARPASSPAQLGDFRILRELGRGGMGVVYEAEQLSLRRRVALKVLRFGAVADKDAVERFRREAETVAHLHHTNIVPIFAVGSEQGVSYYAMQYIEGGSLADAIAEKSAAQRHNQATTPESYREIARWGLEAAEALAHAHQRGVIHRDVKPSNLLLDKDGRVWLSDFGLARRMDEITMTVSGMLMGTPRYIDPEQANAVKRPVDHRTDIYSLGATLYELITGQPVFASDTPDGVISQILTAEPVRRAAFAARFRAIWRRSRSNAWRKSRSSVTPRPKRWPTICEHFARAVRSRPGDRNCPSAPFAGSGSERSWLAWRPRPRPPRCWSSPVCMPG